MNKQGTKQKNINSPNLIIKNQNEISFEQPQPKQVPRVFCHQPC